MRERTNMKPYLVSFTADMAVFANSLEEARQLAEEQLDQFCVPLEMNVEEYK